MQSVKLNERPVNVQRAAEFTGYSVGYIRNLVSKGKIPFHKRGAAKGAGAVRFFESELADWMKREWSFSPAQSDLCERAEKILGGVK